MLVVDMFLRNSHNIFQWEDESNFKEINGYFETGDGDLSSGYGFIKSHTLSHWENVSTFKDIDGDVENCDVNSGYGSMIIHTNYNRMVWNIWWLIMIGMIHIFMIIYRMEMWVAELVY